MLRLLLVVAGAGLLAGQVFLSKEEALARAFGKEAVVAAETRWLTEDQRARAQALAGAAVPAVVQVHTARDAAGKVLGTAYFDARKVRTHAQSLMFALTPDGALARVVVLSFDEPADYLPKPKWYESLEGRKLDAELQLGRGVHAVTGATLTARATVAAARESLALQQVLNTPEPEPKP